MAHLIPFRGARAAPRPIALLLAALLLGFVGGAPPRLHAEAPQPPAPRARSIPYRAVATVGMVGDLVARIAGDRADVDVLVGSGIDPHLYKATRYDIARLAAADIIFANGLQLEGKMTETLASLGRRKPVVFVAEHLDPGYLLADEGATAHADPHVWMDVAGWMRAADAIHEALAEFDPDGAPAYRERGAALRAELEQLDAWARHAFATIPRDRRVMITAHDAFRYLGRAYDVEVHGIQGLSTESEAGLQDINRLVDLIVARGIPSIFVETSVSDKNVRALVEGAAARGHRLTIGGTLYSDAMGEPGSRAGTYVGMIEHNVTTIVRALGGEVAAGGIAASGGGGGGDADSASEEGVRGEGGAGAATDAPAEGAVQ